MGISPFADPAVVSPRHKHYVGAILLFLAAFLATLLWQVRSASAPLSECPSANPDARICSLLVGDPTLTLSIAYDRVADLKAFYKARGYALAWNGSEEAEQQARDARAALSSADKDGLDHTEYSVDPRAALPYGDILLTEAVLRYAHDLRLGRVEGINRGGDVSLPVPQFDLVRGLSDALSKGTVAQFLAGLRPSAPEYTRLASALARYEDLEANGGWTQLPFVPAGEVEKQPAYVDAVLLRLAAEESLPSASDAAGGTERLTAALSHFQQTHGLRVDGNLGKETLDALNVPATRRADIIRANMERWRWMPRPLEARYIMVNVPANSLEVVDHGNVALQSRVVAGRPSDPSPILRAEVRDIVVNPPWNVPTKIAKREILPKLRRDPLYLQKHDMVIKANGQIQQLAGPKSALGTIKLDMPNPFSVYLHDTPSRNAFALDKRHLSHGCVRVQAILPLASIALVGDPTSGQQTLEDTIATGATTTLPVPSPVPVYFAYWTAFVDPDGTVEFRPDIYGRDDRLLAVLRHAGAIRVTRAGAGCPIG